APEPLARHARRERVRKLRPRLVVAGHRPDLVDEPAVPIEGKRQPEPDALRLGGRADDARWRVGDPRAGREVEDRVDGDPRRMDPKVVRPLERDPQDQVAVDETLAPVSGTEMRVDEQRGRKATVGEEAARIDGRPAR